MTYHHQGFVEPLFAAAGECKLAWPMTCIARWGGPLAFFETLSSNIGACTHLPLTSPAAEAASSKSRDALTDTRESLLRAGLETLTRRLRHRRLDEILGRDRRAQGPVYHFTSKGVWPGADRALRPLLPASWTAH